MSTLLEVEDLRVTFPTPTGPFHAVRGVSFTLGRERLGIVGESGSGKSLTGRSLMGLLPPQAERTAKRLAFDGVDLLRADARTLRGLRGRRISLVMQDPKYSLNPVMRIGEQIAEAMRMHRGGSSAAAARRALEMLEVDSAGLDRSDRALLEVIADRFGGGPVGLSTLSVAIGEETDTIEDVLEPYLLQLGMMKRTPRGRVLTRSAWEHLGRPVPTGHESLF